MRCGRSGRSRRRTAALGLLLAGAAAQLAVSSALADSGLVATTSLAALQQAAENGNEPEADWVARLLEDARRSWRWGSVSGAFVTSGPTYSKSCHPANDPLRTKYLKEGAPDAYAQVLGAHLASEEALAERARLRVLELVDTHSFAGLTGDYGGDNQCILELAISIPVWIATARLLESTTVWSEADRDTFQAWLAAHVYPKVAWASRTRANNWGAAGSLAAWAIARYTDGAIATLEEEAPTSRSLAPGEAMAEHMALQRSRMNGEFVGDARCTRHGVQPYGGLPEELRRGATGCDGLFLESDDSSLTYQAMHVEVLVLHAELARWDGDPSLYEATTAPGKPALLEAIRFVIANAVAGGNSWPWPQSRLGTLIVASTYYDDAELAAEAARDGTFRAGRTLPYARITHGSTTARRAADLGVPGKPRVVER